MKYIEHFEDGYAEEHTFGGSGNNKTYNEGWSNGYSYGKDEAKAEERQRIVEVLDSLISDVQKRVLANKINSSEALGAGAYLLKAKKALEVASND